MDIVDRDVCRFSQRPLRNGNVNRSLHLARSRTECFEVGYGRSIDQACARCALFIDPYQATAGFPEETVKIRVTIFRHEAIRSIKSRVISHAPSPFFFTSEKTYPLFPVSPGP